MAKHYDVIVIGGGHNGLVNAAHLARAGTVVAISLLSSNFPV
jgi:phytoene dehydrogenase-like protein